MHRVDAVAQRHRQDQRHHDHQGRKDIQHRPQQQQQDVEQDQEGDLALHVGLDQGEQLLRHPGVNEVIGKGQGHRQNQQDPPHHDHGVTHDPGQLAQGNFPIQEHFRHQHIKCRHRCRLTDHQKAGEYTAQHHQRQRQLPAGFPEGIHQFTEIETLSRHGGAARRPHTIAVHQHDHQQRRHQAGQIQIDDFHRRHVQLLGHLLGDDAVDQQRHGRHQQQPQAT